jgi:hypothetical protein
MTGPSKTPRRIVVSAAFRASVSEMAAYYKGLRATFPNAGERFRRLMAQLSDETLPKLANRPAIGRLFRLTRYADQAEQSAVAAVEALLAGHPGAEVREWVSVPFTVSYVVTDSDLILVGLKHQRQAGY